jgi:hypothetical protein
MKDTKNIVVSNRFSLIKRTCCALFRAADEILHTLFKYFDCFFKTYAALLYIIAPLSNVDNAKVALE